MKYHIKISKKVCTVTEANPAHLVRRRPYDDFCVYIGKPPHRKWLDVDTFDSLEEAEAEITARLEERMRIAKVRAADAKARWKRFITSGLIIKKA